VHSFVAREIEVLGDRDGQRPHRGCGGVVAGPGEREHRAMVIAVDVHVEERAPARGRELVDHAAVAPLRDIRHTLDHPVILACEGAK
jgi:hypothetical protein